MAQLRDALTSELIAEGSPLEVALAARALARPAAVIGPGDDLPAGTELLYDDVGAAFDPAAVIAAHEENVAGLEAAAADLDLTAATRETAAAAAAAARDLEANATTTIAGDAATELEAARDRVA